MPDVHDRQPARTRRCRTSCPSSHELPWVRHAGRLIWCRSLLFAIGIVIAFVWTHEAEESAEPATWAQTILGAMVVWVDDGARLRRDPARVAHVRRTRTSTSTRRRSSCSTERAIVPPFDITRDGARRHRSPTVIYVRRARHSTSGCSSTWQKRPVARTRPRPRRRDRRRARRRRRTARAPAPAPRSASPRTAVPSRRASESMARNDANPPMPEFSTSYVLQEVDPKWLTQAVKPKQFLHIDQAECILCEGCVDICPWKCIHMLSNDADRRSRQRRPARRRPERPRLLRRRRRRLHPLRAVRRPLPHRRHHPGQGHRPLARRRPQRPHQPTRLRLRRPLLTREKRSVATATDNGNGHRPKIGGARRRSRRQDAQLAGVELDLPARFDLPQGLHRQPA